MQKWHKDYPRGDFLRGVVLGYHGLVLIFVNNIMPGDRVRFTLAHELGHIVMHDIITQEMDIEANEFASEFLMPAAEIKNSLQNLSLSTLANLKRYWKTSMQAMIVRAHKLNTISYNQYRYLWMKMNRFGYRLKEPIPIAPEQTSLVKELIDGCISELVYTRTELCKVLLINEDEFDELYSDQRPDLRIVRFQ